MPSWYVVVPLICGAWALQSVGLWVQMRHYRQMLGTIERELPRGFVGAGATRGRLRGGAIVMVAVTPDLTVHRVAAMSGWTVFARFLPRPEFEGLPLTALRDRVAEGSALEQANRALAAAVRQAIVQIEAARSRPEPATPALAAA